jgi:hypothetical protein
MLDKGVQDAGHAAYSPVPSAHPVCRKGFKKGIGTLPHKQVLFLTQIPVVARLHISKTAGCIVIE